MAWSSFIDNGVFVVKFYLRRRPYGTNSIEQIAHVSLPIGKLLYNTKTRSYFLMPGTIIAIPKRKESFEYTSIDDIFRAENKNGNIVIYDMDIERLNSILKGYSEKQNKENIKIKVAIVKKKIQVKSPTLADQLVLGYKRSGLTYWKNNKGQSLGYYLEKIGHLKTANSKSESVVPANLE